MAIVETSSIRFVRFLYCDISGVIRGKVASVHALSSRTASGIGLVKGAMSVNILDQLQLDTGYGATGEVRLAPDLSTFRILPYVGESAAYICNLQELDHSAWCLCPRSVLAEQISKASRLGIKIEAAFEPEFTLAKGECDSFTPIDQSLCFSTGGMNQAADFINSFAAALERQGLEVEQYYPELGHGQHELTIKHAPAAAAADNQIWYRETLRGVSGNAGIKASLAPKPLADQAGNGCHLHLSAWDIRSGQNLFYSRSGLSPFAHHFIAGLLAHLPALTALTCASVNSYRRLKPRSWSSAYCCWGLENREAAIRVPSTYSGYEEATTNLEIKCVDSSCNPYLALAGIIAAGLAGVEEKLSPGDPVEGDPDTMTAQELCDRGVKRLPSTLQEALDALKADRLIANVLGEQLTKTYTIVKESECAAFAAHDVEFELKHHRDKF